MNTDYMKEYIVLAKYLNFTVAAEKCFITQPVLSRHISALESELGVKLLDRTKHSVKLTHEGEMFYREAERMIEIYDQMRDAMTAAQAGHTAVLRVGVLYYGVNKYISPVIASLEEHCPSVFLQITPSVPTTIIDSLMSDKLDVGIFERIDFIGSNRFEYSTISHERLVAVVNESHPLAHRDCVSLSELKGTGYVGIDNYYYDAYTQRALALCAAHGFTPELLPPADNLESMFLTVQSTGGMHLMPEHLKDVIFSGLKFLKLSDEDCFADICLVYKKENTDPCIQTLIKHYARYYPCQME